MMLEDEEVVFEVNTDVTKLYIAALGIIIKFVSDTFIYNSLFLLI
jgi:hypothetical protein